MECKDVFLPSEKKDSKFFDLSFTQVVLSLQPVCSVCNLGNSAIHKSSEYVRGEHGTIAVLKHLLGPGRCPFEGRDSGLGLCCARAESQILSDRGTWGFVNIFTHVCVFVICKPMYFFFFSFLTLCKFDSSRGAAFR